MSNELDAALAALKNLDAQKESEIAALDARIKKLEAGSTPVNPPVPATPIDDMAVIGARGGDPLVARVFGGKTFVTEKLGTIEGLSADNFCVRGANLLTQSGVTVAPGVLALASKFSFQNSAFGGLGAPSESDFPTPAGYGIFTFSDGGRAYVKGYAGKKPDPDPTPVDPALPVCPRGPTIWDGTTVDFKGANVNWDGNGIGELSAYLLKGGVVVEKFENLKMTTNHFPLTWSKPLESGMYDLKIMATKCRGENTKSFSVTAPGKPEPVDPPPVDPGVPVSGNEIPEISFAGMNKVNYLPMDDIPDVKYPAGYDLCTMEIALPYEPALVPGRMADQILRKANAVSIQIGWSEKEMRLGAHVPRPEQLGFMNYQQNVLPEGFLNDQTRYDLINWDEMKSRTEGLLGQSRIMVGKSPVGNDIGLKAYINDFEWGTAFGPGNNEDHAIYTFLAWVISEYAKNTPGFIYAPYAQSGFQSWGRSDIGQYFAGLGPSQAGRVERSDVLAKTNFPEQLYGKCVNDFFQTTSCEAYAYYEDRFAHGYQPKTKEGRGINTPWGPWIMKRDNDWSRNWIANLAGPVEAQKKQNGGHPVHANLGLYNLSGSGYELRFADRMPDGTPLLDGIPDYWQPVENQGDPNRDAWGLHRPIPLEHAAGYAVISIMLGIDLLTLWCNASSTNTTPKVWDGTMHENDADFRPYEAFYRTRARMFNTKVTLSDGSVVGMEDIMDGSQEYLRDQTECRYSGVTKRPKFEIGRDTGDGRGTVFSMEAIPEGSFLKLNAVERKVMLLPFVYQIVNRKKRLVMTYGQRAYTSDVDCTITTRIDGKEINTFHLRDGQIMLRIDRY